MKIFVINGSGRVGKDTFVNLCIKHSKQEIHNISTVDAVKEAATILGWEGQKDERSRKFLSDIKDLACTYSDFSVNNIKKYIDEHPSADAIFIHAREPEDIDRIVKAFNGQSILITNNRIKEISTNHADANVKDYNYDMAIKNNGTLIDLTKYAVVFLTAQDLL